MKLIKILSIIGIVVFSVSFMFMVLMPDTDIEAALGWGLIGGLYGIGYSIVALIKSSKKNE